MPPPRPWPEGMEASRHVASPAHHGSTSLRPAAQSAARSSVQQSAKAQPHHWAEGRKKAWGEGAGWGVWGQSDYQVKEQFPQLY